MKLNNELGKRHGVLSYLTKPTRNRPTIRQILSVGTFRLLNDSAHPLSDGYVKFDYIA
jgi:hypothetical protein